MLDVMCDAFALPREQAHSIFYSDPFFVRENKRVLRVGDRVVSCLTVVERECMLGESVVQVAGIAGVATRSSERRQGYAGRLLRDTAHSLHMRGVPLAALFPAVGSFYRKLGWERAGVAHRLTVAPTGIPAFPEAHRVRRAWPADTPALQDLYARAAAGRALRPLRDERRWEHLLDHVKHPMVYVSDRIEGYLLCEHTPVPIAATGTSAGSILRVLEFCAATPAARRGLTGFLASHTHALWVEYTATLDELNTSGLLCGHFADEETPSLLPTIETRPAVMLRILDFGHLLKQLCPNGSELTGPVGLCLQDQTFGTRCYCLVQGVGRGTPCTAQDISAETWSRLPLRLEGDVCAWSQVAGGYHSAEDACALGRLTASHPEAAAQAALLFPRREAFLPPVDHF